MSADLHTLLQLRVPMIVEIGRRTMSVSEALDLKPGSILELSKHADAELDLLVNNRKIAVGSAVKVGENFGLRVRDIQGLSERVEAMGE